MLDRIKTHISIMNYGERKRERKKEKEREKERENEIIIQATKK